MQLVYYSNSSRGNKIYFPAVLPLLPPPPGQTGHGRNWIDYSTESYSKGSGHWKEVQAYTDMIKWKMIFLKSVW